MPIAYHVDRSNLLDHGDTLELEDEPVIDPDEKVVLSDEEQAALNERYPEGLSWHGARYACVSLGTNDSISFNYDTEPIIGVYQVENRETGECGHRNREPVSPLYEWVFELVRMADFPDRPSRFQSFFGFETREEAAAFQSGTDAQIIEVEYDDGFTADMDLLSCQSYAHGL